MKKTVICLLLALVMAFSLALVAAPTAQAAEHSAHCICGGTSAGIGGHTCANVNWTKWEDATALPTIAGNYYLATDVTYAENKTNPVGVVLCLNGHNITCSGQTAFWLEGNSSLTICDCSASGTDGSYTFGGTVSGGSDEGGCIYNENAGVELNIYGGNFKAPAKGATGGAIYFAGGTLNIYNGIFEGGEVENRGGTINIAGSFERTVCNMYGGIVRNGSNTHATNGGGNIRVGGNNNGTKTSEFNLYGGLIENGTSASVGGNIFVQQPGNNLNVYGGTISGGAAATEKNIYVTFCAAVKICNLDVSTTITKGSDDVAVDLTGLDSSLTYTETNGVYTLTKGTGTGGEPVVDPTQEPTVEATVEPTEEPTVEPTVEPTQTSTTGKTGSDDNADDAAPMNPAIWVIIAVAGVAVVAVVVVVLKKKKA